jgi:hypothetical protein
VLRLLAGVKNMAIPVVMSFGPTEGVSARVLRVEVGNQFVLIITADES